MGFSVAGLLFFRFWTKTRDPIFKSFGIAFFIMAVERVVLLFQVNANTAEDHPLIYLFRLSAFITILVGIREKNVRKNVN